MPKLDKKIDFSKILELMNEGIIIDDEHENIIYANNAFCQIVGRDHDDIVGKKSYIFWDKESEKMIRQVDKTLRKKGISSTYECIIISKNGDEIPVLVSGAPRPEGGSVGIITDLSEIKHNEKQSAILGHAIEKASDAYIVFDATGSILLWNIGAQDIFGYTVNQADKMKLGDVLGADFIFAKDIQYKKDEMRTKNKKGEAIDIDITIEQLHDVQGQYLCVVRDITQYRELQESLINRYQKMQSAYNEFGAMRRKMEYIYELGEVAQKVRDIEEFGQFVLSSVLMLTGVDACVLRIRKKKHLEILGAFGVGSDWWGRKKIPLTSPIAQDAFQYGPQKIFDSQLNTKYRSRALLKRNGFTSMMVFGLTFRGQQIGTLTLHMKSKNKWEIFDDGFLVRYVQAIQVALGGVMLSQSSLSQDLYDE